jgi:hypothetical protein
MAKYLNRKKRVNAKVDLNVNEMVMLEEMGEKVIKIY